MNKTKVTLIVKLICYTQYNIFIRVLYGIEYSTDFFHKKVQNTLLQSVISLYDFHFFFWYGVTRESKSFLTCEVSRILDIPLLRQNYWIFLPDLFLLSCSKYSLEYPTRHSFYFWPGEVIYNIYYDNKILQNFAHINTSFPWIDFFCKTVEYFSFFSVKWCKYKYSSECHHVYCFIFDL